MGAARFADLAAVAVLGLAAAAVFALAPYDISMIDEGMLLAEATRIGAGQVVYRDFFEIFSPGAMYVMAGAFWAFGHSLATARLVSAVVQALTMMAMFAICRRLGVSRQLSIAVALAQLALATTALPIASAHWLATLLTLATVWLAIGAAPRRALWLGAMIGVLIAVQHQKGAVMAVAVVAVLAVDRLAGRARVPLAAELGRFGLGLAAVVVPVFGAVTYAAGIGPVVDALVRFPLQHYRGRYNRPSWGFALPSPHHGLLIPLLPWLPAFVAPPLLRALWSGRGEPRRARVLWTLAILAAGALLSVAYNPDAVHLAIAAPVPLICAVETLSWLARRVGSAPRAAAVAEWVAAGGLTLLAITQLDATLEARRTFAPVSVETALGRVDLRSADEAALLRELSDRLDAAPRREVFGYPFYASLALLVGASNPTRYEILLPGYNTAAQIDETVATLDARRVPYVVVLTPWVDWKDDALIAYLREAYTRVPLRQAGGGGFALFERRPPGGDPR